VVEDIFRTFDMFISRDLSFEEMKMFVSCFGEGSVLSEQEYNNMLQNYCSTTDGLTLRGFKQYLSDTYKEDPDKLRDNLKQMGYNDRLQNEKFRIFTLTFHCIDPINVTA